MPVKPSEKEEAYIREQELKRQLEKARRAQEAMAAAERARLKELHWMHCPKCGQSLLPEKDAGTEIDVCPACRGVWLDANELDQILASKTETGLMRKLLKVLGT